MESSLAKKWPSYAEVESSNPRSLVPIRGFTYSTDLCLGSGSFGKVLLGWTDEDKAEVAVKMTEKTFLKKEPKLKENLEREIEILKLMADCEYVVKILNVQELKKAILLVMDKCDYDLDHLIKHNSLTEDQVITFLYQLAEGMKALRMQNIVHRDLKPGNILIKELPDTGKKIFKLADFGFARRFRDKISNRDINMKSVAGTPVYMAPEALSCLFQDGQVYDDKVDIWSIGALLYKVIVGECGFYAHLERIHTYLRNKGDAIAFEFHEKKLIYIEELPSSVNTRLSEPFREQMNKLLQHMLKVDPRERMSFPLFFEVVDDIITSKIEVVSLLHGTSFKIVSDSNVSAAKLTEMVSTKWKAPPECQIIFSPKCPQLHLCSGRALSRDDFQELLDKSGGSYGHAQLYVLDTSLRQLKGKPTPDLSCLEPLKFALDNGDLVQLVLEAKFSDEIVYMVDCLKLQLMAQLEGLERLAQFTVQEIGLSLEHSRLMESVHQTLATVSYVMEWMQKEAKICGGGGRKVSAHSQELLKKLSDRKGELQLLAGQLGTPVIPTHACPPFNLREHKKTLSSCKDMAKRLRSRTHKDSIVGKCKDIYDKCNKLAQGTTNKTRQQLLPFIHALEARKELCARSKRVLDISSLLEQAELEREKILLAAYKNGVSEVDSSPTSSPSPSSNTLSSLEGSDSVMRTELTKQVARLTTELDIQRSRNCDLEEELGRRQRAAEGGEIKGQRSSIPLEEKTVQSPTNAGGFSGTLGGGEGAVELTQLSQQLKEFCSEVQQLLPTPVLSGLANGSKAGSGSSYDVQELLIMSQDLANTLKASLPSLRELAKTKSGSDCKVPLRIGYPPDYKEGDVAVFVPFNLTRGFTVPCILHLAGDKPTMLLDVRSFTGLDITPGKVPDLMLARLSETPRCMKLENHNRVAKDIGQTKGDFYRVNATPIHLQSLGTCPLLLKQQ